MLKCADTPCFQRLLQQHEKRRQSPWETPLESCITNDNGIKDSVRYDNYSCCNDEGRPREKRKRKRTKIAKNKEEVEGQRMIHIAVERNRRRQMNNHLSTLRSLIPPSYFHRGDQASIVGGAIEFVKELEQLLQSLEAKRSLRNKRELENESTGGGKPVLAASEEDIGNDGQSRIPKKLPIWAVVGDTAGAGVRVIVSHANVKLEFEWRPGVLVKAIAGLEEMRLSVLHLNIAPSATHLHSSSVFCLSFNLKIEEDCKIRLADEIAGAVQRVFNNLAGAKSH